MQQTMVWSLDQEDPKEKEMGTHFNILAWEIPWTVESGELESMVSQRVGLNWVCSTMLLGRKARTNLDSELKSRDITFSKPGFSNTWTVNFQMFKLVLEKAGEPEIKLPTSTGSSKKQESSRNTSTFALLTMPKPLTLWITINCGKLLKRWAYQTIWPVSWETCMQVRKQQLELNMEQQTGSK